MSVNIFTGNAFKVKVLQSQLLHSGNLLMQMQCIIEQITLVVTIKVSPSKMKIKFRNQTREMGV